MRLPHYPGIPPTAAGMDPYGGPRMMRPIGGGGGGGGSFPGGHDPAATFNNTQQQQQVFVGIYYIIC